MKEKRRITNDGYFEVSKDGGNTWTKTRMKPTPSEFAEYKAVFNANKLEPKMPTSAERPQSKEKADYDISVNRELERLKTLENRRIADQNTQIANEYNEPRMKSSRGIRDMFNNQNYAGALETGLAGLQAGYGLQQLLKDKRPVGEIDPAYSALTDEAIAASKYGYTPTQRAILEQDIVRARQAQQARINQLAGGNAAVGLTSARAALNEELMNKYKLAAQDEQLRMQKAQYATGLAGVRAQMGRQLFQDKMNEFMQKQQAGAELLGAGIQNIVDARRYQQEQLAQEQLNKMMYGG